MLIEFFEKEEEHDGVHADPPDEGLWIVAVDEEKLECVQHDRDELNLKVVNKFVAINARRD